MPKKPFLTHSEKHWTPPEATVVVSKKRLQQILKALRLVSGMHNSKERNTVVDNLICDSIEYIEGATKGVYEKKEKEYVTKYSPESCPHINKRNSRYSKLNWWCNDCGSFVPKDL